MTRLPTVTSQNDSMRRSVGVSASMHIVLLLLLYFGLPSIMKPLPVPSNPVPFEIVDIADMTNTSVKPKPEEPKPPEPPPKPEEAKITRPLRHPRRRNHKAARTAEAAGNQTAGKNGRSHQPAAEAGREAEAAAGEQAGRSAI